MIKLNIFTTDWVKYQINPFIQTDGHKTEYYRYKAPEILKLESHEAAHFTKETDIFLLGVLLYEAYNKVHPFEGGTSVKTIVNIVNNPPAPFNCKINQNKAEIIVWMLNKEP